MDAKAKRRVITDMLDKFHRTADRLRRKAYEHAVRSRRL